MKAHATLLAAGGLAALALFSDPAQSGRAQRLFGCKPCQANQPVDTTPRVGDLLDGGRVAVRGESCVQGLDDLVRADSWAAWQSGTADSSGTIGVRAGVLDGILPGVSAGIGRRAVVQFGLDTPVHRSVPSHEAFQKLSETCLRAIQSIACRDGHTRQASLVTDTYGAEAIELHADDGWSGDIELTVPIQGVMTTPTGDGQMNIVRDLEVSAQDPLTLGFHSVRVEVPGLDALIEENCP